MKVGILGTGDVGRSLGRGFAALGNEVKLGARSANHEKALEWVGETGKGASQGTFADAARFGEIIVFATLGIANPDVVKAAGVASFAGKLVIDATNPLDFSKGFPPDLAIKGNDSGGETLQRLLPQAKVVKAFNIVTNTLMFRPELQGGPPDMLIAGDDAEAKKAVTQIVADFGWPRTIDVGGIKSARWLEAMCIVWVLACGASGNWRQAFRLLG
jgi:8-hydroxy-5-deazaflavin:NADPH oxidoreductase